MRSDGKAIKRILEAAGVAVPERKRGKPPKNKANRHGLSLVDSSDSNDENPVHLNIGAFNDDEVARHCTILAFHLDSFVVVSSSHHLMLLPTLLSLNCWSRVKMVALVKGVPLPPTREYNLSYILMTIRRRKTRLNITSNVVEC